MNPGGAAFSRFIGIVVLPFTLFGLFVLIGFLGFSPFVTFFIYFRNRVRVLKAQNRKGRYAAAGLTVGLIPVTAVPWGFQLKVRSTIDRSMADLRPDDPAEQEGAVGHLRLLRSFFDSRELANAYLREYDTERRERIADAFQRIEGRSVEGALFRLIH